MKGKKIILDAAYVTQKMEPLLKDEDLSRYIL
jgi:ATP-dependent protease HslVU (ClpYQ) ATPase subunit